MKWFVFGFMALATFFNVVDLCKSDAKLAEGQTKKPVMNPRIARMIALAFQTVVLWWLWNLGDR